MWNFDKTGFMMGVISSAIVVTISDRQGRAKIRQPGNWEWGTVIQGVNLYNWAILPFIVVSSKNYLASWYRDSPLLADWVVSLSLNRWTTNKIRLEWIKYFNKHTSDRTKSAYRLLMLDGYKSHVLIDFQCYCKENKIVTLYMLIHSSHLLQPLNVKYFGLLKKSYGKEIKNLIQVHISYIIKIKFFAAFKNVFMASFSEANVREGFQEAELVLFNLETVLSKLDITPCTPTPTSPPPATTDPWTSQTPQNAYEAFS
jgi:hypothetical protein